MGSILARAGTRFAAATLLMLPACGAPCACSSHIDNEDAGRREEMPVDSDTGSGETLGDSNVSPLSDGDWYRPGADATWHWQLAGTINADYDVDVYDIDLFDTSRATIAKLRDAGHAVICYFSAGSSEDWRPDFERFSEADMGRPLDGWEGERWIDVRSQNVFSIVLSRLDLAAHKGCDGVEPDNMDAYQNDGGFQLTADDQLAFNRHVANAAHRRGLSVALKNDGDQIAELVDYYDLSVNEQCHEYDECEPYLDFIAAGKPVFNAEYRRDYVDDETVRSELCETATDENIRTLVLPLDLDDSFRFSCD